MSDVLTEAALAGRPPIACQQTRLAELFGSGEPGAQRRVALLTPAGPARLCWVDDGGQSISVAVQTREDAAPAWLRLLMARSTGLGPTAIRLDSDSTWDVLLANWVGSYAGGLFERAHAAGVRTSDAQQLSRMALDARDLVIAHEVVNATDAELRARARLEQPSGQLPALVRWWAAGRRSMGGAVSHELLGGGALRDGLWETAARHERCRPEVVERLPDPDAFRRHVEMLYALAESRVLDGAAPQRG